jgi:penicillin-binding protein 1A
MDQHSRQPAAGASAPGRASKGKTAGAIVSVLALGALFLTVLGTVAGLRFLYHMHQTLPAPEELQNIQPPLVTTVLDYQGNPVHEFHIERRFWMPLEQIPAELQHAVIAIEDRRFYKHWGIDIRRIAGAIVVDVMKGEYDQGASTLTQQLARNVYLTHRKSLVRKIREALTALQIEGQYTKDEILELYLNQVYLGAGVYGVEAASQRYFSKPVSELTLNECAVLAGMIQIPEHYRPDKPDNLERVTRRRNAVLHSMRVMGYIDRNTSRSLAATPVPSNPQKKVAKIAPYFMEMVRQYVERKYGEKALYNGGLTVHTTLDPVAQDSAERASAEHLKVLQRRANALFLDSTKAYRALGLSRAAFLDNFDSVYEANSQRYADLPDSSKLRIVQVSVVALEVGTGAIRSLIGGRDFAESKFNRALQARRQPGSSFKPFVYTVAIDSGFTPATVVMDQPITLETPEGLWRPENYDRTFNGPVAIRTALKRSINLPAIQVLRDVGIDNVINYARRAGLQHRLAPVPALAIGACEATPYEMARAYSIYPAGGRKVEPYFIERIFDKNGKVIEEHTPTEEQVLPPQTAYVMADLMRSVVTGGTGASIPGMGFDRVAAGKTGTTNDYSDAWFVGYTPQIACAVWVGVDERRTMGHGITGSRGAIPIWVPAMKALHRDLPRTTFRRPEGIVNASVCDKTNLLATKYCPTAFDEIFIAGSLPDTCAEHGFRQRANGNVMQRFGTSRSRPRGRQQSPEPGKKNTRRKLRF